MLIEADRRRQAAWLGVIAALIVDFRLRILLALAVALLLANGLYAQSGLDSPFSTLSSLSLAIGASLAVATLFHRWIESPEASRRITGALGWLYGKGLSIGRKIPGLRRLATSRLR